MDPFRVAVRCMIAYLFLLTLLRLAGKRTVRDGTTFEFVLTLIAGDLIDDALWAEVPMSQFVIAAGTLTVAELVGTAHKAAIRANAKTTSRAD